jgi:acetyl-CoA acetyltransferase family protein
MREAVICNPLRTPIGRYGGRLRDVDAETLAEVVVRRLLEDTKLDGSLVDDCIFGQCYPNMEAPAIGRVAAMAAGLPVEVPGFQVDRRCGSGLLAICTAAMQVQTGVADVVIAGGVESMSTADFYATTVRWGPNRGSINLVDSLGRGRVTAGSRRYLVPGGMLETAENVRRQYGISRQEQDEYALRSHQRAVAAWDTGKFQAETVPVPVKSKDGETLFDRDEHPRPDSSLEKLASLRPLRIKEDPDATVTAGNASGENDAAACCFVTSPEKAAELGLKPMGKLLSWATAGVHPAYMGVAPVPATKKALERAGLSLSDIGLIELNEAFAVQVLAVAHDWGFTERDFDRTNVNGSGIALGHPVGATGARIMATLLHEMERRNVQFGLETMCIGGGQGMAAVVERVA